MCRPPAEVWPWRSHLTLPTLNLFIFNMGSNNGTSGVFIEFIEKMQKEEMVMPGVGECSTVIA